MRGYNNLELNSTEPVVFDFWVSIGQYAFFEIDALADYNQTYNISLVATIHDYDLGTKQFPTDYIYKELFIYENSSYYNNEICNTSTNVCPMQLTVTPLGNNCSVETPCFLTIIYNYAMYPYYGYEI